MISNQRATYRDIRVRMIVVVVVLATLYYPALIDAATVVRSEQFGEHLQSVALHGPSNTRVIRSAEGSDEDTLKRNCYSACGWAVYHPHTRSIEYFMKNTCECPDKSYKCVRSSDDLSASAYVYRCRQNTTVDDIESPEDAN